MKNLTKHTLKSLIDTLQKNVQLFDSNKNNSQMQSNNH